MLGRWKVDNNNKAHIIVSQPQHTYRISNTRDGDIGANRIKSDVKVRVKPLDQRKGVYIILRVGYTVDVPQGFHDIKVMYQDADSEGTYEIVGV